MKRGFSLPVRAEEESRGGPVGTDFKSESRCSHPARARNQKGTACASLGPKQADPMVGGPDASTAQCLVSSLGP